ncbi:hypothetical protein MMC08_002252 [Hypocenomyce scalaris]|nr:hypothetical protein [Hypocenomyce scalaris]
MTTHHPLPASLPVPADDGACSHLLYAPITSTPLSSTFEGTSVTLSTLPGLTILFCYPRTATSTEIVPDSWNAIPGARGCTPQACSFRDNLSELKEWGAVHVFGLSTQSTEYQRELKERLRLEFDLLSDKDLRFVRAMKMPTFEWEGKKVVKRVTLAVEEGRVVQVWYPVFPPDKSAQEVLEWLKEEGRRRNR